MEKVSENENKIIQLLCQVMEREEEYQKFDIDNVYQIALKYSEVYPNKIAKICINKNNYQNELVFSFFLLVV